MSRNVPLFGENVDSHYTNLVSHSTLSQSPFLIRSLRAPPDAIRDILEGVLQLMGIFDTSWVSMRSFLAKRGVKEEIISFDAR